ncbi:hypothetical protein [Actinomadura rugatobispora]|uniref:Tetratricopeptide repeat protein n=1 Tax=Actinomadura rugatobispora TaxID=1994 RepID=A0ABW1AES5_9ACTN|nr:hypothetical protein GCM10010200_105320 [Actinomadura rugatobispora]
MSSWAELVAALGAEEPEAVRPLLRRVAEREPERAGDAVDLVHRAAQDRCRAGRPGEARALFELTVEFGGAVRAGWARIGLASLAADEGDLPEAERLALAATASGDPELTGVAWDHLRTLRLRRDDTAGAAAAARLAMDAGHPESAAAASAWLDAAFGGPSASGGPAR